MWIFTIRLPFQWFRSGSGHGRGHLRRIWPHAANRRFDARTAEAIVKRDVRIDCRGRMGMGQVIGETDARAENARSRPRPRPACPGNALPCLGHRPGGHHADRPQRSAAIPAGLSGEDCRAGLRAPFFKTGPQGPEVSERHEFPREPVSPRRAAKSRRALLQLPPPGPTATPMQTNCAPPSQPTVTAHQVRARSAAGSRGAAGFTDTVPGQVPISAGPVGMRTRRRPVRIAAEQRRVYRNA